MERVPSARFTSVVYRLSMLERDASRDNVLVEATGFLGIVNDVDGRDSIESDLALVKACAGNSSPWSSSASSRKTGSEGNSFPGKYMLNSSGRKPVVRPLGRSNLLKSEGAPIFGRRVMARLVVRLALLEAREARWRPSASHWAGR